MNLQQLRYFFDAARFQSVTESAKTNFVTQSTVSQAIRGLEDQLNTKLIHHQKNSFVLTDEGKLVLSECESIFNAVENLKANLSRSEMKVSGVLKVAATNSIALTLLSSPIKALSKKYSKLTIQLKLGNSDQVKEYLRTQEAEIGFILEDDEMDGLDSTCIKEGHFLLVATPKIRPKKKIDRLIITRQNKVEVRELKKQLGADVQIHMEVFSWELIRQLCVKGTGVGYLPDYLVQEDLKRRRLVIVNPGLKAWEYRLLAVQPKKRILSASAQAFVSEILES